MAHTVYAVASGKGGVGKTATTVNLGAALAERGHTVAVVDADLGMANLAGFLGLDTDGPTLHEVLAGEADLRDAVYEIDAGLAAVPSGISLDGFASVETEAMSEAIDGLRESFDYVLLDLGAGLSHDTVLPLALADAVVLVSTPKPVALQDTAKTHQVTERLGGAVAGVVLTRASDPGGLDVEAVAERLELPVLAVIPEDEAVDRSSLAGDPVVATDPDTPATEGFRGLADIVIAESLEKAPVVPEVPDAGESGTEDTPAEESVDGESAGEESPGETVDDDPSDADEPGAGEAGDEADGTPDAPEDDRTEPTSGDQPAPGDAAPAEANASPDGEAPADDRPATDDAAGAGQPTDEDAARASPADEDAAADGTMDAIDELAEVGDGAAGPGAEPTADQPAGEREDLVGNDVDVDEAAEEIASAMEADATPPAEDESGVRFDEPAAGDPESPVDADQAAGRPPGDSQQPPGQPGEGPPPGEPAEGQAPPPAEEPPEGGERAPFAVEGAEPEPEDDDEDEDSGGLLSRFFG